MVTAEKVEYIVRHGTIKSNGVVYKPGQAVPNMPEQTALRLESVGIISIHRTVEPEHEVLAIPDIVIPEPKPKRRGRRKKR